MKVVCRDHQESSSAIDGVELSQPEEVPALFSRLQGRAPFMFELTGENGYKLLIGRGDECGCVQFSPADGTPPYLMAVAENPAEPDELVEFLAGGTLTPIPQRFCLKLSLIEALAIQFVRDGTRSEIVSWEEI